MENTEKTLCKVNLEKIRAFQFEGCAGRSGIPIKMDGDNIYFDTSDKHTLIIGETRSGKTRRVIIPLIYSIIASGESAVVIDMKREVSREISKFATECGYNLIHLDFRDPIYGESWNPLWLPYLYFSNGEHTKAIELLTDLSRNIFILNDSKTDPFWDMTAQDLFVGLALALFEDCCSSPNLVNLSSIYTMCLEGGDKLGTITHIRRYFADKPITSQSRAYVSGALAAPSDTYSSVIAVFLQKIRNFGVYEEISKMLTTNSFDFSTFRIKKSIILVHTSDEKTGNGQLANIFIKQCFELMMDYYSTECLRINFIFDDLSLLPPIPSIERLLLSSLSRRIRVFISIDTYSALSRVYSDTMADAIRFNCANWVIMKTKDLKRVEEIFSDKISFDGKASAFIALSLMKLSAANLPDCSVYGIIADDDDLLEARLRNPVESFSIRQYIETKYNRNEEANKVINTDELIQRIDAKIAQLEKEDRVRSIVSSKPDNRNTSGLFARFRWKK